MKKAIAIFVMTLGLVSVTAPQVASAHSSEGTVSSSGVVTGNWDGIGGDTVGKYDTQTGNWILDDWNAADPRNVFHYSGWAPAGTPANAQQSPIVGDWNGDGIDTPGFYDTASGWWDLRNSNTTGGIDVSFMFGPVGNNVTPLVGDWNGDGIDTVGLFDYSTSTWSLRNSNTSGPVDLSFQYFWTYPIHGGLRPVTGDWNGDGVDTVGFIQRGTDHWALRDSNNRGPVDYYFRYGYFPSTSFNESHFTGDWDGNGTDTPALIRTNDPDGFRLRNSNTPGQPDWLYDMTYLVRYDCNRFAFVCA